MRSSILYTLALMFMLGAALQGCKKPSPLSIDNNQVIQKPFTLYVADSNGAIWHTNDGVNFNQVQGRGSGGGVHTWSVMLSDTVILQVQTGVISVSDDNGRNFNALSGEGFSINPNSYWQSQILDVPSFNRIYLAALDGTYYSDSNGKMYTWRRDGSGPGMNSFTQLKDGTLVGHDGAGGIYTLSDITATWQSLGTAPFTSAATTYLSHFGNMIIGADYASNGVWYYNNSTWTQFTGLPADAKVLSMTNAFDQALLVGTESHGIFRVVPHASSAFEASSEGLLSGAKIFGLTAKSNVYKNGAVKQYIFASTTKGVFRSEDLGKNWVQAFDRNCAAIY